MFSYLSWEKGGLLTEFVISEINVLSFEKKDYKWL